MRTIPHLATALLAAAALSGCGASAPVPVVPSTGTPSQQASDDEPAAEPEPRHWAGKVSVLALSELEIELALTLDAEGQPVAATLDIPAQGVDDMVMTQLTREGDVIGFVLESPDGNAENDGRFELTLAADDTMRGTLHQRGLQLGVELAPGRLQVARPQMPTPPFPYGSEEVAYPNAEAGIELAGTLTVPAGEGPHPAVLLITGSGAQDRDETVFGHKPFAVLADDLTRRGVAVLRVDDRGVGGSGGDMKTSTSLDFATDVAAGLAFLSTRPEIDPSRVGLLGHSEGGLIAPLVAAAHPDKVAFVVLMAGTGVPGSEILPAQNQLLLEAMGVPQAEASGVATAMREFIALSLTRPDDDVLRAAARKLARQQTDVAVAHLGAPEPDAETFETSVDQALETFQTPWMQTFLALDPADALREVRAPVLAVGGTLDLQVPAAENLAAIADALTEANNPDVTTEALAGLNHLLQPATRGTVDEYGQIELTIEPAALELIGSWIEAHTGLRETTP